MEQKINFMMKRLRIVSLANSWVVLREEIRLDV